MASFAPGIRRPLLLLASFALPLVLLFSSLRTLRELDEMRSVYLRNRAAGIAVQLEAPGVANVDAALPDWLAEEEPALMDLRTFEPDAQVPDRDILQALASGTELFRTMETISNGQRVFRYYIPFHSDGRLRIARIDMAASGADFLLVHARHNVLVAAVSAVALIVLFAYVFWSLRRTAQMELRQAQLQHLAHLGTMSAVLAHEIRNPLGTIKGFAQLAGEKADAATSALLAPVLDETRRLEGLVNDLLLYGREPEVRLRPVEWATVAGAVEAYARHAIGDRPIIFKWDHAHWRWDTDPDLLKQVLLNLVRNSIEALGDAPHGMVRLRASANAGRGLTITVEDSGPGITEAVRARLFEAFFTTKPFGTGLGLSITRKLVTTLGGRFTIDCPAGSGTRAEIVFPNILVAKSDGTDSRN